MNERRGTRNCRRQSAQGDKRPKSPDPLLDRITVAEQKIEKARAMDCSSSLFTAEDVSVEMLFTLADSFERERRRHQEVLQEAQDAIKKIYYSFSAEQRVEFFATLYDRFAENYDEHMEKTGHYAAIEKVINYASPYLHFPVLDLTAGTGEPLKHTFYLMLRDYGKAFRTDFTHWAHVNEISPKMLGRIKEKLEQYEKINFTDFDAYELPEHLYGKFRTALCSQTFHLIADKDKTRLVKSLHKALEPGGIAVVIEEDPFLVSSTPYIEGVSIFISSVAAPIKHVEDFIGLFESMDFQKLEARAVWPIDEKHSMRLHLFQKN